MPTFPSVLNSDGKSYAFDNRGSGYGRGEGVVTLVIKRLDDALSSRDTVRAIIRNTGVNQDGKTSGIAVPCSGAQQDLTQSHYTSIGLDPCKVSYVEAQGTSIEVGNAAEMESISRLFCGKQRRDSPFYVGSIKSNIGHLESCSGLASLIKAVLTLENGSIPPIATLEEIRKDLGCDLYNVDVNFYSWQG